MWASWDWAIFRIIPLLLTVIFVIGPSSGHAKAITDISEDQRILAKKLSTAQSHINNGESEKAKALLQEIVKTGFELSDYAFYDLAKLEFNNKKFPETLLAITKLKAKYPNSPTLIHAIILQVEASCVEPKSSKCGKALKAAYGKKLGREFSAKRRFLLANRMEKIGDPFTAYRNFQRVYYDNPTSSVADDSQRNTVRMRKSYPKDVVKTFPYATYKQRIKRVDRLMKAYRYESAAIDLNMMLRIKYSSKRKIKVLYTLGVSYKRARKNDKAISVFEKLNSQYPNSNMAPSGRYQIAVIEWNRNRDSVANGILLELVTTTKDIRIKRKSLFVLGKINESNGDFSQAAKYYGDGLKLKPAKELEEKFNWRLAWVTYRKREFKKASQLFTKAITKQRQEKRDGGPLYWKIKALAQLGKKPGVVASDLRKVYPHTYYGLRIDSVPIKNIVNSHEIEKGTDDDKAFSESSIKSLSKKARKLYLRHRLLLMADMKKRAGVEVDRIRKTFRRLDENRAVWLGGLYLKAGRPGSSLLLQSSFIDRRKRKDDFNSPFWKMYYPAAYWMDISALSKRFAIDPFLALSVIRQESAFNKNAHSPANARGLMQLIPSTSKRVYKKLGNGGSFDSHRLYDHNFNLTLGVAHLSELIKRFKGDMILAIAAYNAGATAVEKWKNKHPLAHEDEFVELIPYPETRGYVKRVLRNWMIYRQIYSDDYRGDDSKGVVEYQEEKSKGNKPDV